MKKLLSGFLFLAAFAAVYSPLHAQIAPSIEWQKCFGGSVFDYGQSIQQTTDGGFIVAGISESDNGDVSENKGCSDYWIVRLDTSGNLIWQSSFGGSGCEAAQSIQQTDDGGFIVAGYSYSNDGDVSGHHGFGYDYWIVKADSGGNLLWQKSLGGNDKDMAHSVQQTSDGGFIVAGYAYSNDGDVSGNHNPNTGDSWLVKLDSDGNLVWQKCLGGSHREQAYSVQQTTDGGFILAGYSESNDGDVSGNHANGYNTTSDYWIVRLDLVGNILWQKSLGGSRSDEARSVQQTADGGFIVAGYSLSDDGDVSGYHGGFYYGDAWVVKLDSVGNLKWQKSLGSSDDDAAYCVQQTSDVDLLLQDFPNPMMETYPETMEPMIIGS